MRIQLLSLHLWRLSHFYSHDPSQCSLGACDDPDEYPDERESVCHECLTEVCGWTPSSLASRNSKASSNQCRVYGCCPGWSLEYPAMLGHRSLRHECSHCRRCCSGHSHPHAMASPCHCFAINYLNEFIRRTEREDKPCLMNKMRNGNSRFRFGVRNALCDGVCGAADAPRPDRDGVFG